MAKTWSIVIFTEEDSVEVVPSSWILNDKCYWPTLTLDKLLAAVKNHDAPNNSWPLYPIRLIRNGTFDDYSTAEKKCKRAEYLSDVNSDRPKQNETESDKNKRKIKKKTFGSSYDEDYLTSSDDNNNLPNKLPPPPRLMNDTSTFKNKKKPKTKSETTNNEATNNGLRNEKFKRNLSIEKYFKEIIRQQNIFKASMWQYTDSLHELTTMVNRIFTNKMTHEVEEATTSFFTMFNFPLQNEEELIRVEEHLNDEKNFNVAMNELAKIGGSSVQNFTQRALQMLVTNDLASTYSWLGRRAKKTFNKLKLADLIIGSIKKSIPNSTNKECEEGIQKWLRRAKERSNNKKRGENNNDIEENNL